MNVRYTSMILGVLAVLAAVAFIPVSADKRLDAIVSIATNSLGVVLGALLAFAYSAHQKQSESEERRTNLAWEMHREFNGLKLNVSRDRADLLQLEYPHTDVMEMRKTILADQDPIRRKAELEALNHLWNIIYFYHRLSLAVKHDLICTKLVPSLFGPLSVWSRLLLLVAERFRRTIQQPMGE